MGTSESHLCPSSCGRAQSTHARATSHTAPQAAMLRVELYAFGSQELASLSIVSSGGDDLEAGSLVPCAFLSEFAGRLNDMFHPDILLIMHLCHSDPLKNRGTTSGSSWGGGGSDPLENSGTTSHMCQPQVPLQYVHKAYGTLIPLAKAACRSFPHAS